MTSALNAELGKSLKRWRILPVVTVDNASQGIGVAQACLRGGLSAIEITLRTPGALDAIAAVARQLPAMAVGAGSVLDPGQMAAAKRAGAAFAVSPGSLPELLESAESLAMPWLPGAATASEILHARRAGYRVLKFFPAAAAGGVAALKQLAGPFTDVQFCPTGGISADSMAHYLALPNVPCVGGSWIADEASIEQGLWDQIAARAAAALSTLTPLPR
jgi:2-dehydro-3-deoxyphosphogluconate aldolase / (4S)-4-hydroxy-2-oxoglutarate aldolase